jgi:copper(I)-binding protein
MRPSALIAAVALMSVPTLAWAAGVAVTGAQLRASIGHSPNSAAYMVLTNTADQPDQLVSASCACAAKVEIHATEMMQGMVMMAPAAPVKIPARGVVSFKPGGLHMMLTGLKQPLADGGEQKLTLVFQRAGAVTTPFHVTARISAAGQPPRKGVSR